MSLLSLFLARAIQLAGGSNRPPTSSTSQQNLSRIHSNDQSNQRGKFFYSDYSGLTSSSFIVRPHSMEFHEKDEVEELVNACLDTSGIDRRYSALIVEELRDCTNLTHDQLRQAAHELTTTLGSNSPQYASFTSSTYDSVATRVPSSDELLFDSSNSYKNV